MKPRDRRTFLNLLSLAGLSAAVPLPVLAAGKIKPAATSD